MSKGKPVDQDNISETPHFFGLAGAVDSGVESIGLLVAGIHLRSGDVCPRCRGERLDYDGLLNLVCPVCGFTPGGGCFS